MTREHILFGVVGLRLGYVFAFHCVVYFNQTKPNITGTQAPAASALPEGHPTLAEGGASGGGDTQRLKSAADTAARTANSSPKDFDAQMKAADAYMEAGGFDEAANFLLRASAIQPDNLDVRSELAIAYFISTPPQADKAIAELRRNLET